MKHKQNLGFTLIELMVVITIIGIISLATYMPYAHHQKKTLVKQAVKEVSQTLSESRNLAIHGLDTGSWNVYVWIDLIPWAKKIDYYTSTWGLNLFIAENIYKTKQLPTGVEIVSINWDDTTPVYMSFSPITGSWEILWTSWDTMSLIVWYKWTTSKILQKELMYYRKSFISDY